MQNQKFTERHFLMTEFIVACILSPLLVIGEWFFPVNDEKDQELEEHSISYRSIY